MVGQKKFPFFLACHSAVVLRALRSDGRPGESLIDRSARGFGFSSGLIVPSKARNVAERVC